jgi:hypothetical protein
MRGLEFVGIANAQSRDQIWVCNMIGFTFMVIPAKPLARAAY